MEKIKAVRLATLQIFSRFCWSVGSIFTTTCFNLEANEWPRKNHGTIEIKGKSKESKSIR